MRITKLIAAVGLTLTLAGIAAPALAVPTDKGSASRDCEGADVRATRADQGLCASTAGAQRNRIGTMERASAVAHDHDLPWWAPVALMAAVLAGGAAIIRRRPSDNDLADGRRTTSRRQPQGSTERVVRRR